MARGTFNATWVKMRVGDELGLTEDDLARLYGVDVSVLDQHLVSLANVESAAYERVLSDVDAARIGYRQVTVSDAHIAKIRALLAAHPFHPLVSVPMADEHIGWRLGGDDAQFVAFRVADIAGIDFEWGEMLRTRLNRVIIWPDAAMPDTGKEFQERLADVTFYVVELTGVL